MEQGFIKYLSDLIRSTYGFSPLVRIDLSQDGVVRAYLDGEEDQRRQMMGHDAHNFHALKQLFICFSKRHGFFGFLYIEFPKDYKKHEEDKYVY